MLPLSAETVPSTTPALVAALQRGLEESALKPRQIEADGANFPQLTQLRVDLSENHLTREFRPPQVVKGDGPLLEISQFELVALPVFFEKAALELRLEAKSAKARLQFDGSRGTLVPVDAATGTVSVKATRTSLEALLQALAAEAAAKQGLEIRKTTLTFTQEGPRAVSFKAEVTAKIFVMSATLALSGRLTIDDELNARLSGLALGGDAMILKLASSYAQPYIARLEGRVFPLLTLTPGELKLRNVELTAGDSLQVHAQFGAA